MNASLRRFMLAEYLICLEKLCSFRKMKIRYTSHSCSTGNGFSKASSCSTGRIPSVKDRLDDIRCKRDKSQDACEIGRGYLDVSGLSGTF
jgi:hypothetical protein